MTGSDEQVPFGHWIDGRRTQGSPDEISLSPADPGRAVGAHSSCSDADVGSAVAAAVAAFPGWRDTSGLKRGRLVRDLAGAIADSADRLAELIVIEEGKTLAEARVELDRTVEVLLYHSAQAWAGSGSTYAATNIREKIYTVRAPVGVVGVITPWNFPALIPAWKLGPALVHGNTVVWKPSEQTPVVASAIADLSAEVGFPDGVLNVIFGAAEAGAKLVSQPAVEAVTFTGSARAGRRIREVVTARSGRVQMELGGHSGAIVLPDAELDNAVTHIVNGAMLSAGQKCTATRRLLLHGEIHDTVLDLLRERVGGLRVGDPLDEGTDVGPLISARALGNVLEEVERAVSEGAVLVAGGDRDDAKELARGHYMRPTVLTNVTEDMRIAQEEVFGPVLSVLEVTDLDQAVTVMNGTRYGLSASIFTSDENAIRRFVTEVDAGMLHVNNATTGGEGHVPFGGMKGSTGYGPREQGETAREFFTTIKSVYHEIPA